MVYADGGIDAGMVPLGHFQRVLPFLSKKSIMIFDDIHWSKQMWGVWKTHCRWEGLAYTINVGRFGVCLWVGGSVQPTRSLL
jgi:hypothetical protein